MIPVEEIRKNYEKLDDPTIQKIALNPKGLRKEVVEILNNEIRKRNININLIEFVKFETNFYDGEEREKLIYNIKNSVCTNCNEETELKGYKFNTLTSFIIALSHDEKVQIICSSCAKKMRLRSMLITLSLGWWSREGLFATPVSLISDFIEILRKEKYSKEVINEFIDENTGSLRRLETQNGALTTILKRFNQPRKILNTNK